MAEASSGEEDETALLAERKQHRAKKSSLAHLALFGSTAETRDAILGRSAEEEERDEEAVSRRMFEAEDRVKLSPRRPIKRQATKLSPARHSAMVPPVAEEQDDLSMIHDDGPMDFMEDEPAPSVMEEEEVGPAPAAPSPKRQDRKKLRVMAMPVEEEEEEEEGEDPEDAGSTSHLTSSKPVAETTEDWRQVRSVSKTINQLPQVKINASKLPMVEEDGEEILKFFWFDAYEGEGVKAGTVYLFGKVFVEEVAGYVSCCVAVNNVERNLFFLPREYKVDRDGKPT